MVATAKSLPRPSAPAVPELVVPPPRSSGSIEPPPDSGVRESVNRIATPEPEPVAEARPLSYSIYTVAQLDSRSIAVQPRPGAQAPRWPEIKRTSVAAGRALLAWRKLPAPRPPLAGDLELAAFATMARAVARAVPWRRLAFVGGGVAACVAVLFFAVVTVAELTDDLKPGKHIEHAVTAAVIAPKVAEPPPAAAAPAAPSAEEVVEAAPPPPPKATKKKKKAPKPAATERFVP